LNQVLGQIVRLCGDNVAVEATGVQALRVGWKKSWQKVRDKVAYDNPMQKTLRQTLKIHRGARKGIDDSVDIAFELVQVNPGRQEQRST
jgi:hypothetical protein